MTIASSAKERPRSGSRSQEAQAQAVHAPGMAGGNMKGVESEGSGFDFSGRCICFDNCELGEGITYDPITDIAWWFDIKGMRLHEWQVTKEQKRSYETPFMGSALARIDDDRQLVVADCGLMIRDVASNLYSPYRVIDENSLTRANDSRMHQSGSMWTSRMGCNAEPGMGAIYHVNASATTLLYSDMTVPNAICFSPDGKTGYFVDSDVNRLMRVDVDVITGLPSGQPSVLWDGSSSEGCLDGAVCDSEGLIWSACWGQGRIDVYSPSGQRLGSHAVPTSLSTCPGFVGLNADRILVTSAWMGMDRATRLSDPNAGRTFELDIPVKGRHEPAFSL